MGMYDREPNFGENFDVGDRFVITDLTFVGTITTRFGPAEKSMVTLVTRESYPKRVTFSALGKGISNQARRVDRSDFPHVAELIEVDLGGNQATKRFARIDVDPKAFVEGEDGPPVDPAEYGDAFARTATDTTAGGGDDDIPF